MTVSGLRQKGPLPLYFYKDESDEDYDIDTTTDEEHFEKATSVAKPTPNSDHEKKIPTSDWTCKTCTLNNEPDFLRCDACGTTKANNETAMITSNEVIKETHASKRKRLREVSTNGLPTRFP